MWVLECRQARQRLELHYASQIYRGPRVPRRACGMPSAQCRLFPCARDSYVRYSYVTGGKKPRFQISRRCFDNCVPVSGVVALLLIMLWFSLFQIVFVIILFSNCLVYLTRSNHNLVKFAIYIECSSVLHCNDILRRRSEYVEDVSTQNFAA